MPPDERQIRRVLALLRSVQGPFVPKPKLPPVDELVATVLSQNTSDVNSERAFAGLKGRFPSWVEVVRAGTAAVADAIRAGGLAEIKAPRIQRILATIEEREGKIDLERLRRLPDAEVEAYLRSLPGVGRKTAACVLVFSLGRPAFPVDTHVHRVAGRLGWIPVAASADAAHDLLAEAIPPDIRYDLHVALISHGRTLCRPRNPACPDCPVRDLCVFGAGKANTRLR
ncbi:MAG: endonuclease III [Candidatus Dormibacteraeota bacterium]|nr:endonuclease III [Candidatus Dormibacteraeota bacterium]